MIPTLLRGSCLFWRTAWLQLKSLPPILAAPVHGIIPVAFEGYVRHQFIWISWLSDMFGANDFIQFCLRQTNIQFGVRQSRKGRFRKRMSDTELSSLRFRRFGCLLASGAIYPIETKNWIILCLRPPPISQTKLDKVPTNKN